MRHREREREGHRPEQPREAVEERVAGAEHDGRLEYGPVEVRAFLADQLLGLALGAQVVARRIDGGLERGNLQQPSDARGARGLKHHARQFEVRATETAAAESALVEDADQVDHGVLAAKPLAELRFLVDVAVLQREPGQDQKVLVKLAVARQHRDPMIVLDQAGDQAGTEKARAAEDA